MTRAAYDEEIAANADYFTLVRKVGPGRFERHERATLAAIRRLAAGKPGRWMVYAVWGQRDAHVENIFTPVLKRRVG